MLDEPRVKPDAIRRAEPDILVSEPEPLRSNCVGARQAGQHGHVNELLLERHQRRHPHHGDASGAVSQRLQPSRHPTRIRTRLRFGFLVLPPCVSFSTVDLTGLTLIYYFSCRPQPRAIAGRRNGNFFVGWKFQLTWAWA